MTDPVPPAGDPAPIAQSKPRSAPPDATKGAAALLEEQLAECVLLVRDLSGLIYRSDWSAHERLQAVSQIGGLLDHCANVGKVVARLNGNAGETRHRVIVEKDSQRQEAKRAPKQGRGREGVRKT